MENTGFENVHGPDDFIEEPATESREEFAGRVRAALDIVLAEYRGQGILRNKINACLEDEFGVRSREVTLQIPDNQETISLKLLHPLHGEVILEA